MHVRYKFTLARPTDPLQLTTVQLAITVCVCTLCVEGLHLLAQSMRGCANWPWSLNYYSSVDIEGVYKPRLNFAISDH